ncbi:hypothetical protein EJB05_45852, partial [Eragrostis curvula]
FHGKILASFYRDHRQPRGEARERTVHGRYSPYEAAGGGGADLPAGEVASSPVVGAGGGGAGVPNGGGRGRGLGRVSPSWVVTSWALTGPFRYFAKWASRYFAKWASGPVWWRHAWGGSCVSRLLARTGGSGLQFLPPLIRRLRPSRRRVERRRPAAGSSRLRKVRHLVFSGSEGAGSAAAMFSRVSRLGARLLREARAGSLPSSRGSLYQAHVNRPSTPLVSPTVRSLRNNLFSTATSNCDQGESSQEKEKISVTFVNKDGSEQTISVPVGMNILEAAHENDIELEGACEGSLACSTCHVIVMDVNYYNKLEEPTDEENDMLDLAFGLTETSRLGCQVIAKPELDGMRLALPAATRNFAVDGFVPKPH